MVNVLVAFVIGGIIGGLVGSFIFPNGKLAIKK
jgi:hypothetical protein